MSDAIEKYDVAIVGGGLAGLAASILLGRKGYTVILLEKETYPFHKVCGEYISMESWNFLAAIGLGLRDWDLPEITTLRISSPNGNILTQPLPLGGFGISRYKLDNELAAIARASNVDVRDHHQVKEITYQNGLHQITTDKITVQATVCCAAFGKRSNLDIKWQRPFVIRKNHSLNNYIAIKYHAKLDHPPHLIELHNFKNGYCGISRIEDNQCCICYLTTAGNLRAYGNNIARMEQELLSTNVHLKDIFSRAAFLYKKPLAISQISFDKKTQIENHMLMLGDAAGLITPLCGNGMSMALHSAKIAAELVSKRLENQITQGQMESAYQQQWQVQFSTRLLAGRILQSSFGKPCTSNLLIKVLKPFPTLINKIIVQTHGEREF